MIQFHTVKLNDGQFHYAEAAGPGPALVILHGLTGSHAEFLHLVPELARQAHVYVFDLRGHGRSEWTTTGYQIADYGRDVITFLQQIVGQPAIVLGHSLGGLVSTWLAANKPHLLQGIILEDTPFYIIQMPRLGEAWFHTYFVALREHLDQHHANGVSLEEMVAYVGLTPVDGEHTMLDVAGPEAVRERALQLHQVDPATLDPILEGNFFNGQEPDDLLAQIRCPVHLVAAQSDRSGAMTVPDVQRAVAQMPHCTHAIIEDASHDVHLDQPQAFLREVTQFLNNFNEIR